MAESPLNEPQAMDLYDDRWKDLWTKVLSAYEEEAGHPPPEQLDDPELEALQGLLHAELGGPFTKKFKRAQPKAKTKRTLEAVKTKLQTETMRFWSEADAEDALQEAELMERGGDWHGAREAYAKAMVLSPVRLLDTSLRFAQLLHVMATSADGEPDACEQVLRHAISGDPGANPAQRPVLARLALLLLQGGREEEAIPLLQSAGYKYRLASWVWRYPEFKIPTSAAGFPGCVFDDALPPSHLYHLQEWLAPESKFWSEHGYNEVCGSGENGYFSYVQDVVGPERNTLDAVIRHIWEFLKKGDYFPDLANATVAEWWAHKRPHACGHQMHYDSDNEGIGGVRNPICSCVLYVVAPPGVGGPTLVTDQALTKDSLGSQGWFVYPSEGRLAAYDGTYFHGVIPGCGVAPSSSDQLRRITFMVAFWRKIQVRPFGSDGLAGSSRPVPDPAEVLKIGQREYTWHQALSLPLKTPHEQPDESTPRQVPLPGKAPVWVTLEGDAVPDEAGLPDISACFQI